MRRRAVGRYRLAGYDRCVMAHAGEPTVGEVMVRRPKTLSVEATVGEARVLLERASVQMLLLVDGSRFRGAVTAIPDDAGADEPARRYVEGVPPVVSEETPVSAALELLEAKPHGRIVVLDGESLVGLVCLTADGERFCGSPGAMS